MGNTEVGSDPRPAGGGRFCPLPDFLDSSKTAADIETKLSVPSPASIWRLPSKLNKNPWRIFKENGVLVTCSAILGQKAANV